MKLTLDGMLLVLFAFFTIAALSIGADTKVKGSPGSPQATPEMRQQMADMHQKMAECLRSDKPLSECHQQMMQGCQETMGTDGCPMMMGGMGKTRSMHHKRMAQPATEPADTK